MRTFTPLLIAITFAFLPGCNLINPTEKTPDYLQINSVDLTTDVSQGSNSHNITDVWLDVNFETLGVYELPKTIPVLAEGETNFRFSAGIMDNGIAATRVLYPFYNAYEIDLDLNDSLEQIGITPQFTYKDVTQFSFIEDFENGNLFDKIGGDTNLVRITDAGQVFEGIYSAQLHLDLDHLAYEGRSHNAYSFEDNLPVYLELNYKCNHPFDIGLYGTGSSGSVEFYKWHINSSDEWNKIYLSMGEDVKELGSDEYQILIKAILDSEDQAEADIFFDNVKLVSF